MLDFIVLKAKCELISSFLQEDDLVFQCGTGYTQFDHNFEDNLPASSRIVEETPYANIAPSESWQREFYVTLELSNPFSKNSEKNYFDYEKSRSAIGITYEKQENVLASDMVMRFGPESAQNMYTGSEAWYVYFKFEY